MWESDTGDGEVYGALTDSPPSAEAEPAVIVSLSSPLNRPIKGITQQLYHERTQLILNTFIYFPFTRRTATDVIVG